MARSNRSSTRSRFNRSGAGELVFRAPFAGCVQLDALASVLSLRTLRMKLPTPHPVDKHALMAFLQASFPQYEVGPRQSFLVVKQSDTVGANVVVRNNKIIVVGTFGSMGMQIGFTLGMLFLGILIPLVLYFALLRGKHKAMEQEVAAAVQNYLTIGATTPGPGMNAGYAPAM